jgi:hypothetical protein
MVAQWTLKEGVHIAVQRTVQLKNKKIEALIDVSRGGLETALTCEGLASPKGAYPLRQRWGHNFNRGKINIIDQLTSVNQ